MLTRHFATHTQLPADTTPHLPSPPSVPVDKKASPSSLVKPLQQKPVFATLYTWPSFEPDSIKSFNANALSLPLRKDILHRAVIYEGDNTRQGTASTKYRTEVRGSGRKIRPQKGTGRARLSDRKSPSIRGGGVAHGPHPRDFGTDLPDKIYSLAWRTALSHRYKSGELIIVKDGIQIKESQGPAFLANLFTANGWGQGNKRSMVVVGAHPPKTFSNHEASVEEFKQLSERFEAIEKHAKLAIVGDVDVKDLLSCGRLIIEEKALRQILDQRRL